MCKGIEGERDRGQEGQVLIFHWGLDNPEATVINNNLRHPEPLANQKVSALLKSFGLILPLAT